MSLINISTIFVDQCMVNHYRILFMNAIPYLLNSDILLIKIQNSNLQIKYTLGYRSEAKGCTLILPNHTGKFVPTRVYHVSFLSVSPVDHQSCLYYRMGKNLGWCELDHIHLQPKTLFYLNLGCLDGKVLHDIPCSWSVRYLTIKN